ncbi:MAG: J domain-containing protein [Usitatibacter sp.]
MPRAEAASVVTQLIAFLKEPTRHRPRFTHGREVLEGGHHAFRFALGKFPPGLLHDTSTHARAELREAAEAYILQVCFWEGATYYQVLCLPPGAARESIKESYQLLMALIHPDRTEASAHAWPAEWAQRANRAYEVLSDEALRAAYDSSLRAVGSIPPPRSQPRAGPRANAPRRSFTRRGLRYAKAGLVMAAVGATLLLLEAWYGGTPRGYSLFHGRAGERSAAEPRYLGQGFFRRQEAAAAPASFAEVPGGETASASTVRHEIVAAAKSPAAERVPARAAPRAVQPPPAVAPAVDTVVLANAGADGSVRPLTIAQPAAIPLRDPRLPTTTQIEDVVARLVGYYEAGEADQLMGLLANDDGFWQKARARQAYADFFRATRQRRLRVDSLQWQSAALAAHARGEATVQAEFLDEPRSLDRKVEVEMDIALRDGEPKITRLSLYPNAP